MNKENPDTVFYQLERVKALIAYHNENIKPYYPEMDSWERKEYEALNAYNLQEEKKLEEYINENKSVLNTLLK